MIELSTLLLTLTAAVAAPGEAAGDRTDPRTAVVLTLERRELPAIEDMQGWFAAGEEPLEVVAVERGPGEVVVVRDPAAQHHLDLLAKAFLDRALSNRLARVDDSSRRVKEWDPRLLAGGGEALLREGRDYFRTEQGRPLPSTLATIRRQLRDAFRLGAGVRLRFVSPLGAPVSRTVEPMNFFNLTPSFPAGDRGFLTFARAVPTLRFYYRFADAVALAGRELHLSGRRRAVVVLIKDSSPDESLHSAATAAQLMGELQVPVFVWSVGRGDFAARWSGERPIREQPGVMDANLALAYFEAACDELRSTLEAQRVVWLEGRHPASLIRLTEAAERVRMAGEVPELTEPPPKVRAVLGRLPGDSRPPKGDGPP